MSKVIPSLLSGVLILGNMAPILAETEQKILDEVANYKTYTEDLIPEMAEYALKECSRYLKRIDNLDFSTLEEDVCSDLEIVKKELESAIKSKDYYD